VAEQALEMEIYVSKEDTIKGAVFGKLSYIRIGTVAQLPRYFNIPVLRAGRRIDYPYDAHVSVIPLERAIH